ncbi:monocarboxylate transporter 14-like [Ptychodera flava]|uniref:monocarboxylate transporter 14-like n=1 Tax=Ptychodera flava TaxID=63121 RepID=UPI00396A197E
MTKTGPQDITRRRWLVLASCFFVHFICGGGMSANGIYMVEFLKTFDESAETLSWVFTIPWLITALITPVTGYFTSVYGARKVVAVGATFIVVGMVTTAFTDSVHLLYLTFSVSLGTGFTVIYIPSLSIIAEYFTDRYAFANGMATVGGGLGNIIFPLLVQTLIEIYGWHGAILITAGLSANVFVCALIMKPVTKTTEKRKVKTLEMQYNIHSEEVSAFDITESGPHDSSRVKNLDGFVPLQDDDRTTENAINHEHDGRRAYSNKKQGETYALSFIACGEFISVHDTHV